MAASVAHPSAPYTMTSSQSSSSTSTFNLSLQSLPSSLLPVITSFLSYSTLLPLSSVARHYHSALFDSDVCWRCHPVVRVEWDPRFHASLSIDGRRVERPPFLSNNCIAWSLPPYSPPPASMESISCLSTLRHIRHIDVVYGHQRRRLRAHRRSRRRSQHYVTAEMAAAGFDAAVTRQLHPLGQLTRLRQLTVSSMERLFVVTSLMQCCSLQHLRVLDLHYLAKTRDENAKLVEVLQPLCTPQLLHLSLHSSLAADLAGAGFLHSIQTLRVLIEDVDEENGDDLIDKLVERLCTRELLPSITHLHVEESRTIDLPRLFGAMGDQLVFLALSGRVALPATVDSFWQPTLRSLHLHGVTLRADNLRWLSVFPSLTQLSLIDVVIDPHAKELWDRTRDEQDEEEEEEEEEAKLAQFAHPNTSVLSDLPASLQYLQLHCSAIPNAADVDFLFSHSHTTSRPFTRCLTHLSVTVSAAVLDAVCAHLPSFPSVYPRLTHFDLQCPQTHSGRHLWSNVSAADVASSAPSSHSLHSSAATHFPPVPLVDSVSGRRRDDAASLGSVLISVAWRKWESALQEVRERVGERWCSHRDSFEQARLDKQWCREQLLYGASGK